MINWIAGFYGELEMSDTTHVLLITCDERMNDISLRKYSMYSCTRKRKKRLLTSTFERTKLSLLTQTSCYLRNFKIFKIYIFI